MMMKPSEEPSSRAMLLLNWGRWAWAAVAPAATSRAATPSRRSAVVPEIFILYLLGGAELGAHSRRVVQNGIRSREAARSGQCRFSRMRWRMRGEAKSRSGACARVLEARLRADRRSDRRGRQCKG